MDNVHTSQPQTRLFIVRITDSFGIHENFQFLIFNLFQDSISAAVGIKKYPVQFTFHIIQTLKFILMVDAKNRT